MNSRPETTHGAAPDVAALTPGELIGRLVDAEDRASIELVDACVAHGDSMVASLQDVIDGERSWDSVTQGDWWLLLHAAFILGRIPTASAGMLLARLMRRMDEHGDQNLQDWLAGGWPALFVNKPRSVVDAVRALAEDRSCEGYIRAQALDVVLDVALREGASDLEAAIDWEARFVTDPSEDWWFRAMAGMALLGFPRERHRAALRAIADGEAARREERGFVGAFATEDIEGAFSAGHDQPDWQRFDDPWQFYTPAAIASRQERWRKEASDAADGSCRRRMCDSRPRSAATIRVRAAAARSTNDAASHATRRANGRPSTGTRMLRDCSQA